LNQNYHQCWNTLFEPFHKNQKDGLNVHLHIGDHVKEVLAFCPVAIIMGDAKSNDTLTCCIPHYKQPRMSRACYTSFADCCKHDHQSVEKEDQEELSEQSSDRDSAKDKDFLAELKSILTIWYESSLFKMDFGNNIYGQF
jgi:hypothetical protein